MAVFQFIFRRHPEGNVLQKVWMHFTKKGKLSPAWISLPLFSLFLLCWLHVRIPRSSNYSPENTFNDNLRGSDLTLDSWPTRKPRRTFANGTNCIPDIEVDIEESAMLPTPDFGLRRFFIVTNTEQQCANFTLATFKSIARSLGAQIVHSGKLVHSMYFVIRFPGLLSFPICLFKSIPCISRIRSDLQMKSTQEERSQEGLGIQQDLAKDVRRVKSLDFNLNGLDIMDNVKDSKYTYDLTGKGINVYVLDTGIFSDHFDFGGRARLMYEVQNVAATSLGTLDCTGHGSHVSGIIGGRITGIAKKASIHMLRVMGCGEVFLETDVMEALEFLEKNLELPAIINMSIGNKEEKDAFRFNNILAEKLQYVTETLKIPIIMAAGNFGIKSCDSLHERVKDIILVGSTDTKYRRAPTSNYGPCVDIFAPGKDIYSHSNNSLHPYAEHSGTSQATPFVSGIAALIMESRSRHVEPKELKELLLYSSINVVKGAALPRIPLRRFANAPLTQKTYLKSLRNAQGGQLPYFFVPILLFCTALSFTLVLLAGIFLICSRCSWRKRPTTAIT